MAKQRVIRWGIIGCGKIAEKVASDFSLVAQAELVAVAARDQSRADIFAEKFGISKAYSSYAALAGDSEIDIVYVATIHPHHANATLLCLNQGKAVMCEKPLGMDGAEVHEMMGLAKAKNLFLMEAIWTRFFPIIQQSLELVATGGIGKVTLLKADFGFRPSPDIARLFEKDLGGGALLDIGIYPLFLSLLMLGVPEQIKSTAVMQPTGVDESCGILLNYPDGAMAVLHATFAADTPTEAWIYGTEGTIHLHGKFHCPSKMTLWREGKVEDEISIPILGNGYAYELAHVSDCLLNGEAESPILSHEISLQLVSLLDRVREQIGLSYP